MFNKVSQLNNKQATVSPKGIFLLVIFTLCFVVYSLIPPVRNPQHINIFLTCSIFHSVFGYLLWSKYHKLIQLRHIMLMFIISRILLLPMIPWLSDDAFAYLFYGKISLHGYNVYALSANNPILNSLHDEAYSLMAFKEFPSVYPPFTTMMMSVSAALARLFGTSLFSQLLAWKIIILASEFFAWLILLKHAKKVKTSILVPLFLYMCIPLTGIELIGQGHNDALLLPFLAIFYAKWNSTDNSMNKVSGLSLGIIAGICAAIKITPAVIIIPVLFFNRSLQVWMSALAGLSISIFLLSLPYFSNSFYGDFTAILGFAHVLQYYNSTFFNSPPLYVLRWITELLNIQEWWLIAPKILSVLRAIGTLIMSVIVVKNKHYSKAYSMYAVLLFSTAISPKVHSWYFIPLILLASLAHEKIVFLLSILLILTYSMYSYNPPYESYIVECGLWFVFIVVLVLSSRNSLQRFNLQKFKPTT